MPEMFTLFLDREAVSGLLHSISTILIHYRHAPFGPIVVSTLYFFQSWEGGDVGALRLPNLHPADSSSSPAAAKTA